MKIKSNNKLVTTLSKSRRSKSLEAMVKIYQESINKTNAVGQGNGRDKSYPYWWTGEMK